MAAEMETLLRVARTGITMPDSYICFSKFHLMLLIIFLSYLINLALLFSFIYFTKL